MVRQAYAGLPRDFYSAEWVTKGVSFTVTFSIILNGNTYPFYGSHTIPKPALWHFLQEVIQANRPFTF